MLILTGSFLVLITWIVGLLVFVALGLPIAALFVRKRLGWLVFRSAMWWGLLIVTILSYLLNLFLPLQSGTVLIVLFAFVMLAILLSAFAFRSRITLRWYSTGGWKTWLPLTAVALAVLYMSTAALGPVTNFDSGLYHLGAISYAAEYRTIPGLANIYFPFGYSNAEFPLAALMGTGPWGPNGFRLLNGMILFALAADFVVRLRSRQRSAGTYVLGFGILLAFVPMIALADYWVTSPSQDSAVLFLTVVASGYLVDFVFYARARVSNAATVFALSVVLVMLRPTMIIYSALALVTVAIVMWRVRTPLRPFRVGIAVIIALGMLSAGAAALRDYFLSGWLQYPLSIVAFDVPWRATDPTWNREATLGYHRNPAAMWNSIEGWEWVGPWISQLPSKWEFYLVLGSAAGVALLAVVAILSGGVSRHNMKLLALATLPSVGMVLVWWVATPPSFRFAWGPIFTALTIPAGVLVWLLKSGKLNLWPQIFSVLVSTPVILVVVYSSVFRLDTNSMSQHEQWLLGIQYSVTPIVKPAVQPRTLESGLEIQTPSGAGLCWQNFPLCTAQIQETVRMRGAQVQDGFLAQ